MTHKQVACLTYQSEEDLKSFAHLSLANLQEDSA
jgi:hypothetical protein